MKTMSEYTGNDIYCDLIIPRKITVEIVQETEHVLAFHHTKPHWPVHIVVVCKAHIASLLEVDDILGKELLGIVKEIAGKVKNEQGACRIVINLGEYQDSKHLHIHVSSGQPHE